MAKLAETQAAVASPAFVKQIEGIDLETASSTPQELSDMIRSEMARWTKVIQSSGIDRLNGGVPIDSRSGAYA